MTHQPNRICVFFDADNVNPDSAEKVLQRLSLEGRFLHLSAYANFSDGKTRAWRQVALKWGITLHQRFNLSASKNGADIALAVRATEQVLKLFPTTLAIVSDDADFAPLAEIAREHGVVVRGFGIRESARVRAAYDTFEVV